MGRSAAKWVEQARAALRPESGVRWRRGLQAGIVAIDVKEVGERGDVPVESFFDTLERERINRQEFRTVPDPA